MTDTGNECDMDSGYRAEDRTNPGKVEYAGIDWFRLIAAFLVVSIHTSPLADWNQTADFVFTRILARVAVPFFLMTSGFFLYVKEGDGALPFGRLAAFQKKTAVLYAMAILLYLPLTIYNGTVQEWKVLPNLLKDVFFDGTFYHLWYLPAAILGASIVWLLLKKGNAGQASFVCLLLYLIGLFGDSYYGISEKIPFLKAVYQYVFRFSDYTRNGLFYTPIFFLMGALYARQANRKEGTQRFRQVSGKKCIAGLALSFSLMLVEGLLLYRFHLQQHDSMYFFLLPTMFFLFPCLLLFNKGKDYRSLRDLSMIIYLIHPAVLVGIRGFAKAVGLESLLIENSFLHFLTVALGSFIVAALLVRIGNRRRASADAGPIHGNPDRFPQTDGHLRSSDRGRRDRAWMEICLSSLRQNVEAFRKILPDGCRIMAVVKANAYGHGAEQVSAYLNRIGVNTFAVATIDEGISLRRQGVNGEILILGYTPAERASELFRYRLSQTVADAEHAMELDRFGKPLPVHIKVNTGMNRLGESFRHEEEIASVFDCKNLIIEGIFTHLCVADSRRESDIDFTNLQIRCFYQLLYQLKSKGIPLPRTHVQSSYGVLNYPSLSCDYARIGIALYGVLSTPDPRTKCSMDLKPVLALRSRVTLVRTIGPGEGVSYGREFIAQKKTTVAVISVGYADGYPRALSDGKGQVLIHGQRASILGRICMDQLMADVTGIPGVKRGDVVTLIGRDGMEEITAEEVAENAGTITNELLSRLGDRPERIILDS
jgi:serine/alanine racemase